MQHPSRFRKRGRNATPEDLSAEHKTDAQLGALIDGDVSLLLLFYQL